MMIQIIEWLKKVELLAATVYEDAGIFFRNQAQISELLTRLAAEEYEHYHAMASAANLIQNQAALVRNDFVLDEETRQHIEGYFYDIASYLSGTEVVPDKILLLTAEAELSEWNDIFIYVINSLKEHHRAFASLAARIEMHKREMIRELKLYPPLTDKISQLEKVQPVWSDQVLIVDESEAVRTLIQALLADKFHTQTAATEEEARHLMEKTFYNMVITDTVLEIGNGLHLYEEWKKTHPEENTLFLFHSSFPDENELEKIKQLKLPFLQKPSGISELRTRVSALLKRNT